MSTSPTSTAAVLEYLCLFTHDLRRKQKRWQDGRLKYHTFNKRVMVHDERGNFVGDMHWRHDYAFDEGEEIELERGGVIVQVSSLVAREETDLSELLGKRVKEKEQRHLQKLARSPARTSAAPRPGPRPSAIPPDHFQLRHRPLHQVIGTPTGHHGKALVPKESPFEQRQQAAAAAATSPDERTAKRRKHEDLPPSKSGYATSLFGQSLTLSATPASSVPVKRQPRQELNLDHPGQLDRPSASEDADIVPREKPRISRHLNQKSGYAQGLFGQSLTLSHTPVSSVPPRRQPRHEPTSSWTLEADTNESHADAQPALREQPKVSHHFNQPVSKLQTVGSEKRLSANSKSPMAGNDGEESRTSRGKLKETPTIPQGRCVEESKRTASEDDDVIEIDDPGPVSVHAGRKPRTENGTRDTEPAQPKRTKSVTDEPTTRKKIADHAAPRMNVKPSRSIFTSRRPDEHVTELKLKSRKRGLLMISDAPKKPRLQANGSSARSFKGTETQYADELDGELISFPTLDANGELKTKESGDDMGRTRTQRTIPTEMGEFNDLFRSSSPAPQERPVHGGDGSTEDSSGRWRQKSTEILPELDKELVDDGNVAFDEEVIIDQVTTHPSPSSNKVYDLDRIPSSSEEDVPSSWPASSPRNRLPPNNIGDKEGASKIVRDARKAGHTLNTASTTTQQRPSRRKVILDNDEESDAPPEIPERMLISPDVFEDDAPAIHEAAPMKQSKLKKTAAPKRRKSDKQDSVEAAKADDEEQHDEQTGKRRRSTRTKRSRVDEFEEPSLASELDVSEEERAPKKRQRGTSQTSENRPRLERIKKNIKSRELVGFNLAALNAPLGPRGIGMPFNILSSPIDESIQKLMSKQAVMEASPDPAVEYDDETTSTAALSIGSINPGRDRILVDESPAAVPRGRSATTNKAFHQIAGNMAEVHPVQAQRETVTKGREPKLGAGKNAPETVSGSGVADTLNNRSSRCQNATEVKEPASIVPLRDRSIVIEQRADDCDAGQAQAKTYMPQAIVDEDSAVSGSSTNSPAAQNSDSTDQKHRSNAVGDNSQEKEACQVASASMESTQRTSVPPVAAATSTVPPQASVNSSQRRPSANETHNDDEPESEQCKAGATGSIGSDGTAVSAGVVQIALGVSSQNSTPATRQQPSTTIQGGDGKPEVVYDKPKASADIRGDRTASPAARPRVTAPFKRPTPATRRQPSMTTAATEIHTSLTDDGPDTMDDGQSSSTYASAAPFTIHVPLQKPIPASVRPTSNEKDDTNGVSDISEEEPETKQAPASLVQRHNSIGLRRPIAASPSVNNIKAVRPQAEVPENQVADSIAKPSVKIVNPASRGRKAALASDAVGQPPPKEPERPKRKMKFPGFQSARGEGPWSREAFDLLESGRPD
ncbi:hypothetical protein VMCG_01757 [Cytospora schulzeri]|uniref:5'-3' DNA helicase ZGRF1-like N-terminal domain-containing protein n=1 Tax=Cytospora schulzeri TaxID=448051 RepID=A0A423X369_9PEZI|nr:hypothetical protein VMCG_01757 [Valsa malicola]